MALKYTQHKVHAETKNRLVHDVKEGKLTPKVDDNVVLHHGEPKYTCAGENKCTERTRMVYSKRELWSEVSFSHSTAAILAT
jgi:hypothetical protein